MSKFSHLNESGQPIIVDISDKAVTKRSATARSVVVVPPVVFDELIRDNFHSEKGAVFQTAILAGILAAKKTGELIPLCHPLFLENCHVQIECNEQQEIIIECTTTVTSKTGVEMEALTGASVAALTVYDMCKALSHDIVIKETKLIRKTGGKNDFERTA
ncbi:cyclic pyranopterin monophosphate synthase MoaC [Sphingobacterium suaedae]|uniref:Cyclic pyranopterin monophosphate synthase MoaC n=1 Tax=Sphingobacterium suaedae TaxID=1686402 RepID=A0ABW5KFI6_9SPHI